MKQMLSCLLFLLFLFPVVHAEPTSAEIFGKKFSKLDHLATGEWWKRGKPKGKTTNAKTKNVPKSLHIDRDAVIAFALYTHDTNVLKLTAQLFPLMPNEPREVRLEIKTEGEWRQISKVKISYPGWSAHFRIEGWDSNTTYPYRVRHGEEALFEGLIRRDPSDKK